MIACGWTVDSLQSMKGWDDTRAYQVIFFAYAGIGLVKLLFAFALSPKVEAEQKTKAEPVRESEQAPLLGGESGKEKQTAPFWRMLPSLSRESAVILVKLSLLFSLDSFASGLMPLYVSVPLEQGWENCLLTLRE